MDRGTTWLQTSDTSLVGAPTLQPDACADGCSWRRSAHGLLYSLLYGPRSLSVDVWSALGALAALKRNRVASLS